LRLPLYFVEYIKLCIYHLLFHDNIASVFLTLFVPCMFLSVRGVLVFTEACIFIAS